MLPHTPGSDQSAVLDAATLQLWLPGSQLVQHTKSHDSICAGLQPHLFRSQLHSKSVRGNSAQNSSGAPCAPTLQAQTPVRLSTGSWASTQLSVIRGVSSVLEVAVAAGAQGKRKTCLQLSQSLCCSRAFTGPLQVPRLLVCLDSGPPAGELSALQPAVVAKPAARASAQVNVIALARSNHPSAKQQNRFRGRLSR
jgi:hypothetical protein